MQKESTCPFFYASDQGPGLHLWGNWQAPLQDLFRQPCITAQEEEYFVVHLSENSTCCPTTPGSDHSCHDSLWNGQVDIHKMYHSVRCIWSWKALAFGWPQSWSFPKHLFLLRNLFLQSQAVVNSFNDESPNWLRIWCAVPSELWCPLRPCLVLVKFVFEQSLCQGLCCRQFLGRWFQGRRARGREEERQVWVEAVLVRTCRKHTEASGSHRWDPCCIATGTFFPLAPLAHWLQAPQGSSLPWGEWDNEGMWKGAGQAGGTVPVHKELSPAVWLP